MKNSKNQSVPEWKIQHETACQQRLDFYADPITGLMVSTRYQHLERGSCCGSGCRHCPYDGVKGHREIRPDCDALSDPLCGPKPNRN